MEYKNTTKKKALPVSKEHVTKVTISKEMNFKLRELSLKLRKTSKRIVEELVEKEYQKRG